jgi:hypothetical protein
MTCIQFYKIDFKEMAEREMHFAPQIAINVADNHLKCHRWIRRKSRFRLSNADQ